MEGIVFMEMAKVTSKGQITIPVSIRRRLKINEGDKLLFIDSPDGVVMVNPDMLHGGHGMDDLELNYKGTSDASILKEKVAAIAPQKNKMPPPIERNIEPAAAKSITSTAPPPEPDSSVVINPAAAAPIVEPPATTTPATPVIKPPVVATPAPAAPVVTPPVATTPANVDFTEHAAALKEPMARPTAEPAKPLQKVHGFDLSTLLDEIRSIGSNI